MSPDVIAQAWQLVYAAGRMSDGWAEGDDAVRKTLWRNLHASADVLRETLEQPSSATLSTREHELLVSTLVYHWRTSTSACGCGWSELGRSHAEHVTSVYEEALRREIKGVA